MKAWMGPQQSELNLLTKTEDQSWSLNT